MKKLLLTLAGAVLGFIGASAASYDVFTSGSETWTGDADGYTTSVTVDGKHFTLVTDKASSTTNLVNPGSNPDKEIRIYKSSTLTISSTDFEFNTVVLTATAAKYIVDVAVSSGWTVTSDKTALTYTLTSKTPQKSVTFDATGAQVRVSKIVVADEAVKPAEATAVTSVKETIALASGTPIKVDYALTVGFVNSKNVFCCDADGDFIQIYNENTLKVGDIIPAGWAATYTLYNGVTPEIEKATLPAEVTAGTFTPKEVAPADLTTDLVNSVVMVKNVVFEDATPATKTNFTGKVGETELSLRNNYTLGSVPAGTYDLTLVVTINNGDVSLYVASYNTEDEPVVPVEATVVKNVRETIAVADGTLVKVDYTVTVAWVNVRNIFVCDAAGDFIQIYAANTYKVGDVIPAGWEATYKHYNDNTPELTDCTLPEEVTAGTFTPKEVAADEITAALVNSVVLIKNVTLDAATPDAGETDNNKKNFTGTVGETTLNFRNNYKVESVPAGVYDITVVVTLYNGEPSLYVTNFAKSSGLSNITVDNDAPAEYYNLNGVRVANPGSGLYIRVKAGQAEKVML